MESTKLVFLILKERKLNKMATRIKLYNPYIEKVHRVTESPDYILGSGGQQRNEGYTGPYIDIDTGEKFTINLAGWAEVTVIVE